MLVSLGLTALLGFVFRDYIDNWGHAGGALVGFGLGFADRHFLRGVRSPSAWGLGVMAGLVIVFCGMAQLVANRREAPLHRQALLREELYVREVAYRNLRAATVLLDQQADHRLLASRLDALAGVLDRGATRSNYRRLRELAGRSGNWSALGSGKGRVQAAGRGSFSTASRRARRSPPRVLEGTPQDGRQEPVNGTFGPLTRTEFRAPALPGHAFRPTRPFRALTHRPAGEAYSLAMAGPAGPGAKGGDEIGNSVDGPVELGEVAAHDGDLVGVARAGGCPSDERKEGLGP